MLRRRLPLLALLVLTAGLNLWALARNGWANDYYAAAVRAMSQDWHLFLYGSFDASGVMTVDKPPLALWVQALSARVFGFDSVALLVPQALMGVASVWLTYDLVRRRFGALAGLAGGLVLALTPISVAIARHNNPDALLILCSVAAIWFLVRGLEDGRTRWLLLCGLMVGLGFETKMAAALLVVPGIAAAWLWVAPRRAAGPADPGGAGALGGRVRAFWQLLAGGVVMAVVGLAWPVLVWLTPAADRPWVSGTSDNSIWSLIAGYNGAGRLAGQAGGPGGGGMPGGAGGGAGTFGGAMPGGGAGGFGGGGTAGGAGGFGGGMPGGTGGAAGGFGGGMPGGGGGGAGGVFGGDTGPLRLLDASLGGQAGWLLGFALVAGVAILVASRLRPRDPRTGWLVAIGGAFATCAVAFSFAGGIFHPYYVSLLAPFTAALVGAGVGLVAEGNRFTRVAGPAVVLGGVATSLVVLDRDATGMGWALPLIVVAGVGAAIALALQLPRRARLAALAVGVAALLAAPATWAAQTLGHATNGTFPAGGPATAGMGGGPGGRGGPPGLRGGQDGAGQRSPDGGTADGAGGGSGAQDGGSAGQAAPGGTQSGGGGMFGGGVPDVVLAYVKAHGGGTIGVASQSGAAQTALDAADAGVTVAGIGGFSGRESQVTLDWLADAVDQGRIRWILPDGDGGGMRNDSRTGASDVIATAEQVCTAVELSDGTTLYDCQGQSDALRDA